MNYFPLNDDVTPQAQANQVLILYKSTDTTPPGWIGVFYQGFEGSIPGEKYWVVNVNNQGELGNWLNQNNKKAGDVIGGKFDNKGGISNDWFSIDNPDFEFALSTLLILVGLGILTGATFIDLLYTALIIGGLYLIFKSVKELTNFAENLFDNIIPKSVQDWLDKNFPGGYKSFKMTLLAGVLAFAGYKTYKHIKSKKVK